MPAKTKTTGPTQIDSLRHQDTRINIPTEEMRDFLTEDNKRPLTVRYPRDASRDPQLVWRGKDEQDDDDLEVSAPPIYVQEKIHPQAIIEDFRRQNRLDKKGDSLNLFADFNGINFEQMIDFYKHQHKWSNRMILGDSLRVMASLAHKEGLKGQVQMIYLDPPYGIKFGSNWQVSTRKRDVKDGNVGDLTRQPEQVKAFRDTWTDHIHSYLAYLRDRLTVAHDLLTESGSVFVQIGDENVHLVRCLLDEVFGVDNFVASIAYKTSVGLGSQHLDRVYDQIVWYTKSKDNMKYRQLFFLLERGEEGATRYNYIKLASGEERLISGEEKENPKIFPINARFFTDQGLTSRTGSETTRQPFQFEGKKYVPSVGGWRTSLVGLERLSKAERILSTVNSLRFKKFFNDFGAIALTNFWADVGGGIQSRADPKVYVVQTSTKIIERCLLMTTDPGDLVLDPTCGSGTTAYVAEQWGRRWITIDTSRVALALARTRLMSGVFPYYLLKDSEAGLIKEAELNGVTPPSPLPKTGQDVRQNFVYERVPHITLKSIANNEEIDAIHAKWQEKLEPLREKINSLLQKTWAEWEMPRDPEEKWPAAVKEAHENWWKMRRERQQEIDASIARRADREILYDKPYEDSKRLRVTGPFTVESLSPHRILAPSTGSGPAAETALPKSEQAAKAGPENQFVNMILDNLRKAGVQNTFKNERLKFDWLKEFAGLYLHGEGQYTEKSGETRRVAVHIGPEHGTVTPDDVKEAAKEAVRGQGFDLLLICGLAFDSHVSEEAKRWGNLTILPTRINADLTMPDEVLKKTGSGNLFMIFGEPDVTIHPQADGQLTVEIHGLDIYDPTTGQIRSSSTADIACWFIDTDYNEESFFVRHAYFTGEGEPYERLKRALKAEVDESAWQALYRTVSRPFPPPSSGHIAIKVINHYGDEVLKVYKVR